jgi:hypothetical protein
MHSTSGSVIAGLERQADTGAQEIARLMRER